MTDPQFTAGAAAKHYTSIVYGENPVPTGAVGEYADMDLFKRTDGYKMPVAFKAFKEPLVKWSIRIMACALVVAWIVMMVGAKRLHEARKLGEWKQQECGREYMESETARYEMSKVYESHVRRYIYVALAMFMFLSLSSVLLMALYSIESSIVLFKGFNSLKFLPTKTPNIFERPNKMVGITIVGATLALIAQTSTLSGIWGDRMSEKSYTQATTVAQANEDVNKKQMPALIQATVIGTLAMAAIVFVMYNKIFKQEGAFADSAISGAVSFIPDALPLSYFIKLIFMFVLGLALTMGLVKSYGTLNGHFSEYRTKAGDINTSLTAAAAEKSPTEQPTRDYLLNNIRRIDPKAELSVPSALDTNYSSDYYGYAMHEDGAEVGFLNTNRITVDRAAGTIEAMKDDLAVLVQNADIRASYNKALTNALAKAAANAALLSDKPEIAVASLQKAIASAFAPKAGEKKIPVQLNDALRFEMNNLLKDTATDSIKLESVRNAITALVTDRAQKKANMGTSEIMGIINSGLFASVFPGKTGADLDNVVLSREDTKRDSIIDWFKCNSSTNNGLCDVILLESLGSYMSTRAASVASKLVTTNEEQNKIRNGMSMLRQNPLDKQADGFIGMVYIWSLILVVLFAYMAFHKIYRSGPELVTIGSVVLILALVLALSFYGWFMGQAM